MGHRPIGHRPGFGHRLGWGWNGHRVHAAAFRYPAGYGYRHWVRGQLLPVVFLSPVYFYTDFVILGLEPPPYGYRWIRFGPDLLLVNIRTGEIMDVEYGVFY